MSRNVAQDRRARALRKWRALQRMTVERGCTAGEAATAAELAAQLAARWGFTGRPERPDIDEARIEREEWAAALRWHWEYRRCGKDNCWCAKGGRGHGPYRYAKRRVGRTVRSIYLGR